jgi:hypothetical protein
MRKFFENKDEGQEVFGSFYCIPQVVMVAFI